MIAIAPPAAAVVTVTITTPFLPPATLNAPYSVTLAAKGGATGLYTWRLTSGTLTGTGLNLSTAGVISGTSVLRSAVQISISATDTKGVTGARVFTLGVAQPISVTTTALRIGVAGAKYPSTILTASGGTGGNVWSVAAGSLTGTGLSFSATGVLSGTPVRDGAIAFTVRVTDRSRHSATRALSVAVNKPLTLRVSIPARLVTGATFSTTAAGTGGSGKNAYSINSGALPGGLTIDSATGRISGRPSPAGTYSFSVQVKDSYADIATQAFNVVVGPAQLSLGAPAIDQTTLNDAVQGSPYSQQFTVSNLPGTVTWSVAAGALPSPMTLNSASGLLSGTPTAPIASYSFTIQVSNGGSTATQDFTLNVLAPIDFLGTPTFANGTPGFSYFADVFAEGGICCTYTYAITGGSLPQGLSMDSTGFISGTPVLPRRAALDYPFTVTATDSSGDAGSANFTIHIDVTPLTIYSFPASGSLNIPFGGNFSTLGGTGSGYIYSLVSGSLPNGVTFDSNGVFSGTPTVFSDSSTFDFTVQVTDSDTNSAQQPISLFIDDSGLVDLRFTAGVDVPGFSGPAVFGNPSDSWNQFPLPSDSFNNLLDDRGSSTGISFVYSTPSAANASNSSGGFCSTATTLCNLFRGFLKVAQGSNGTMRFSGLPAGSSWDLYFLTEGNGSTQLSVSINSGSPVTTSFESGNDLSLISGRNYLVVTGFADASGSINASFNGLSGEADISGVQFTPHVTPLAITAATLSAATQGVPYDVVIASSGGTGVAAAWTATNLPDGLVINGLSGEITGIPTAVATPSQYSINITLVDTLGYTASRTFLLLVQAAAALSLTSTSLPGATANVAYNQALSATGGFQPFTWQVVGSNQLPSPLTLDAATGIISGRPGAPFSQLLTFEVDDSSGNRATQNITFTVNVNAIQLTTTSVQNGTLSIPYFAPLLTSFGTGQNVSFSVTGGALPAGLSFGNFGSALGIKGTPAASGNFSVTVQATDSSNTFASQSYSFAIRPFGTINVRWQGGTPDSYSGPGVIGGAGDQWMVENTASGTTLVTDSAGLGAPVSVLWAGDRVFNSANTNGFCTPTPNSFCPLMNGYLVKDSGANGTIGFAGLPGNTSWDVFVYQQPDSAATPRQLSITINGTTTAATTQGNSAADSAFILNKNYLLATANTNVDGLFQMSFHGIGAASNEGDVNAIQLRPHVAPVVITQTSVPAGVVNTSYNTALTAAGGVQSGQAWIVTGSLPTGVTLNGNTGVLSGKPTASGLFNFTVKVVDAQLNTASQAFALQVFSAVSITTSSLPPGALGAPYSQTIAASGGFGIYTFAISAGTLPPGLQLGVDGTLSGTPTAPGTFAFTVQVTDSSTGQAAQNYSLIINGPVTILTSSLPDAAQGTSYAAALSGAGGIGALAWSFGPGTTAASAGLSIDSKTGALSGTPNTFGTLAVVVKVQDTRNNIATKSFNLRIGQQTPESSDIVVADSGTGQIVRMYSDGSNPLTVCATGCHASDIAADSAGNVYAHDGSGIYKITPGGVVTTVLARAGGVGGVAVDASGNVVFVDNQSDSIYRVTPAGVLTTVAAFPIPSVEELQDTYVALDRSGNYVVVSDDGGAVKIYRFTPGGAATTLATFSELRSSGLAVTGSGLIEFVNYSARTLVAFDPAGAPNNSTTVSIPTSDTVLYGVAIDPANGDFIITGRQTGSVNRITGGGAATTLVSSRVFTSLSGVAIVPALQPLSITTLSLPAGQAGNFYGPVTLRASGGSGNFTWTSTGLAPGLQLSSAGVLTGGPTAAGNFISTFTVTDNITGLWKNASLTVGISPRITPLSISQSASRVSVAVGGAVSATFGASGGAPPYTFTGGGFPTGVSIGGGGALSGSASQPGAFNATIVVSDSIGQSASTTFTITVLGLSIPALPTGLVGTQYSAGVNGLGGLQPYSFSANGLPAGLSIGSNGAISGIPTAAGNSNVTITVSDAGGATISGTTTITVLATGGPVTIPSGNLPDGTVGVLYSQSLSAAGGKPPYTWALVSGSAPDGLSFASSGILSGTPTTPGSFSFGAQLKDSSAGITSTTVSIRIKPALLSITSKSPLASGMNGVEYPSIQLAASGGVTPYKWALTAGSLPAGMTLDADGTISGTPTATDTFSPAVTATDAAGNKATAGFALTVRPAAADLILSSGTIGFSATTGADSVPAGQSVTVQSTAVGQQISYSVQVTPAAPWLTLTSGNQTPDSINAVLTDAALSLTPGDYSTSIKATCGTGTCTGSSQTVNVTLSVSAPPPRLKVDTDVLSFSTTQNALGSRTASITLENAGGGSLGVGSVACLDVWCRIGGVPARIGGGATVSVDVTVNPSAVPPGLYRTTVEIVTSAGKGSVPVILFIAQNSSMTLSSTGTQFSMPVGGAPGNPSESFLVSVNTASPVNLTASSVGSVGFLKVNTSAFGASASQPGVVSFSIDAVAAAKLAVGAYYGQISVAGSGLVNSPQFFQVILNVTPATDSAKPDPQPAGLLFLAVAGASNPPQQTVTVFTSASSATPFQAAASSGAGWLVVSPVLGSTSQAAPGGTSVAANTAGLKAGVYTGTVSYAFAGSGVRSVNVTLVVSPLAGTTQPGTLTSASEELARTTDAFDPRWTSGEVPVKFGSAGLAPVRAFEPRAACAPSALAAVQTGLVSNFSAPTGWPTPLALKVVDNCGEVVTGAQIVTTFTNGDPPLAIPLVDPGNGLYSGTWTPRKAVANLTINARIGAAGFKDLNMQLVGKVTPNAVPLLTPHGTVHAFAPLVGAPLAPGNIAAIYGSNLAIITGVPNVLPLPTDVNGTQVLIGGIKAPIYFTSDGQVNAQIPYELEPNKQYQVIVSANGALSTPDSIQIAAVVPGLAANADGTVIAQHADLSLINAKSPAKGGEMAVVYMSGLGSTSGGDVTSGSAAPGDTLATPIVTPTVTVGGFNAKIEFVGLTPGLVGLYQMNFDVPAGLTSGDVPIVVTQGGSVSSPVLLPYTP